MAHCRLSTFFRNMQQPNAFSTIKKRAKL